MKLIIDSADIKAIKTICNYYPVDGVTTNPTILTKSGRQPYEALKEIRSFIGSKDLHVQVISQDATNIMKEAKIIVENLGRETFIKIPVTLEGVKAIKDLSEQGFNCTGTAVYSLEQAFFAAKAGAKWIAPYVSRINKLTGLGVETVIKMQDMLDNNGFDTQILGASFHQVEEVTGLAQYGVGGLTISPDFLMTILDNKNVADAVERFTSDFTSCYGKNTTMKNVK